MKLTRRTLLRSGATGFGMIAASAPAFALSESLTDIGGAMLNTPPATIYTAREIVTLDPARPAATAVAVVNGRILWAGSLDEVKAILGSQPYTIDDSFSGHVLVPGFIAQHDHPVLAALTMSSEILSIEEWVLPDRTVPAVTDKQDFMERLSHAVAAAPPSGEAVLSWGYHPGFFGRLTKADLDTISTTKPIVVWGRSCHEMYFNSATMTRAGINDAVYESFSYSAKKQSSMADGHFWEQGLFAVLPHVASFVASPERLRQGLELTRDYMHAKGITLGNEPGGILAKQVQDGVNAVFSSPDMPFRWSFMVDGKSMVAAYADDQQLIAESQKLASWYGGMTSLAPMQVKLFADGAIYSQLMKVRKPYLDGHDGAWMMDEPAFDRAFRVYWDAGYQIHIHVNGDAGLDRVLGTLEANLRRNPRFDHRTTIVHFAVSDRDQVDRIKALGAIVSGNPYYVSELADQYSKVGLGPQRADEMVRLGDLTRAGIPWSLHSDMPMAPADPLFLMWCAVNRITTSGRVAAPEQRVSAADALRGVTIEAAYSLKLEDEVGTISPGKRANFTVLADNPLSVDPLKIKDIAVWGTVMEGRILPAAQTAKKAELSPSAPAGTGSIPRDTLRHALTVAHAAH